MTVSSADNLQYTGRRILEAMHEAVLYTRTIFDLIHNTLPPSARRILEFGAGDGAFVDAFQKKGVPVDCVEIDSDLRRGLAPLSPHVYQNIREVEDDSCDFIYSINVLEHIPELQKELAEIKRKLRPPSEGADKGGVFFVFVPAFRLLWTSLDDEVGHVTRFTRGSLTGHLEGAGFQILRMEYFDSLGFPAALTVRILEKLNLFRYGSGSVKFYDRRIFPISRGLDLICRYFVGKNLLAVARRR